MRKKQEKVGQKNEMTVADAAGPRNARGRWEVRRVNPPGVLHAFDLVGGICFAYSSRRQGCGGFNRYAHSAVPIWMTGRLEYCRTGGLEELGVL